MRQRYIVHTDADSFFISVETALRPGLGKRPAAAVGGGRGVVLSANYPARSKGVKAGMPVGKAQRLCPDLATFPGRHKAYSACGKAVFETLEQLGGTVEQVSIDEAYWDITDLVENLEEAKALTQQAREMIRKTFNLPFSAGIAGSKSAAKMACAKAKPDGLAWIEPGKEKEQLAGYAVTDIPGVGPVTASKLEQLHIATIKDLAEANEAALKAKLGAGLAHALQRIARGEDTAEVKEGTKAKSLGTERTFEVDIRGSEACTKAFETVLAAALGSLAGKGEAAAGVSVMVKSISFQVRSKAHSLPSATDDLGLLSQVAQKAWKDLAVGSMRAVGVAFFGLDTNVQQSLWTEPQTIQPAQANGPGRLDDCVYYGMPVKHRTLGQGTVIGLDAHTWTVDVEGVARSFDRLNETWATAD